MKLQELILKILENGIPVNGVIIHKGTLGYEVGGSGNAVLFQYDKDTILCETRYNEIDEITNFDDLILVAWHWFIRYKDRSPFQNPDSRWLPHFEKKGWIEKVTTTKVEYKIK